MVVYRLLRILCGIEIAQPGLCTSHECPVAKNYPGFFSTGSEWLPKNSERGWRARPRARCFSCVRTSDKQQSRNNENGNSKKGRQSNRQYRRLVDLTTGCVLLGIGRVQNRSCGSCGVMETKSVRALRKFDNNGILGALGNVVLKKFGA